LAFLKKRSIRGITSHGCANRLEENNQGCGYVIDNSGSLDATERTGGRIFAKLKAETFIAAVERVACKQVRMKKGTRKRPRRPRVGAGTCRGEEHLRRVGESASLPQTHENSRTAPSFSLEESYAMFATSSQRRHIAVWIPLRTGLQATLLNRSRKSFHAAVCRGQGWVGVELDAVSDEN